MVLVEKWCYLKTVQENDRSGEGEAHPGERMKRRNKRRYFCNSRVTSLFYAVFSKIGL